MRQVALSIALMVAACAVDATEIDLFDRLKALAGPNAVGCGTVKLRESTSAAFDCARAAQKEGKPFWVAAQMLGTDSALWRGVALQPNRTTWLLAYDSDVHGGGGYGKESIDQGICDAVQFSSESEERIRCQPIESTNTSPATAIRIVLDTQGDKIRSADNPKDWWHDTKERAWSAKRPFEPGRVDTTHTFIVTYRVDGVAVASWEVDTRAGEARVLP